MHYYIEGIKNFINFSGRTGRKAFWMFMLINAVLAAGATALDNGLGIHFKYEIGYGVQILPFGYLTAVYWVVCLLPTLGIQVRRLHDTGKTGWLFFLSVTIIGAIWLLILYLTPGNPGNNKYSEPES